MRLFSTTIAVVVTALCLIATGAAAQTTSLSSETIATEPIFRLTSVRIGRQAMLLVVPPAETNGTTEGVSGQSLATLLNFFLEVPAVPTESNIPTTIR